MRTRLPGTFFLTISNSLTIFPDNKMDKKRELLSCLMEITCYIFQIKKTGKERWKRAKKVEQRTGSGGWGGGRKKGKEKQMQANRNFTNKKKRMIQI